MYNIVNSPHSFIGFTACQPLLSYIMRNSIFLLASTYIYNHSYAHGVMVAVIGIGHGNTSSNLDVADCISHNTNTLEKDMNPIILPPAMGK